jgi:phosphatidylglycerophosphatase A
MDQPTNDNISDKSTRARDYLAIPPIPATVWRNPLHFIAFGFGTGSIPFAPGTFGTLIAIPFYLAMQSLSVWTYLAITLLAILGSIWICDKTSRDIGIEDHQGMCLDEVVGFLVTMFCAPIGWKWILAGFLLFRLFDIWKPWPIHIVDAQVKGGFGMILDDVMAGIYSCLVLQVLWQFFK